MKSLKKVAAIHDMSGVGRCSLTVIIPILSAMGLQVCPVPTAVLSTHTGGFDNMVFRDLTDYIAQCYQHYRRLEIDFDAVYSGFLASAAQIDSCLEFFSGYKNALKIVDPVMGDNGKPYKTYTKELCSRMGELAKIADVITPNLTEAAILLGEDYTPELSRHSAEEWLKRLCDNSDNSDKIAVITGAVVDGKVCNIGAICNNGGKNIHSFEYEHIPTHYPGTGDIFASVLVGAMLKSDKADFYAALKQATDFAQSTVKTTYELGGAGYENRNGVMFEPLLRKLL